MRMSKIISFEVHGDFKKLTTWLQRLKQAFGRGILDKYGRKGVDLLAIATPKRTGRTALSWYYEIEDTDGVATLKFCNSNLGDGWCPIAIILQYGHGTGTGGWVEGIDYINPAIQPLFEDLAREAWDEVTQL